MTTGRVTSRTDQRTVLEAFSTALGLEVHNLTRRPHLLWQQVYNRLQWVDGPSAHSATDEIPTGAPVRTVDAYSSWATAVAWSPDGSRIASGSQSGPMHLWDAAGLTQLVSNFGHEDLVRAVVWSPDSTRVASCSDDHTLQIWNTADYSDLTLKGHTDWVFDADWSPDGTRIVSGSADKTVKFWDAASGTELATVACAGWVTGVAWSPDGARIACAGSDKTIVIRDATTGAKSSP